MIVRKFLDYQSTHTVMSFSLVSVPRTACLGDQSVALFSGPFESRPADSLRREVFRQQAVLGCAGWFAPVALPPQAPLGLPPALEEKAGPLPPVGKRPKRR